MSVFWEIGICPEATDTRPDADGSRHQCDQCAVRCSSNMWSSTKYSRSFSRSFDGCHRLSFGVSLSCSFPTSKRQAPHLPMCDHLSHGAFSSVAV